MGEVCAASRCPPSLPPHPRPGPGAAPPAERSTRSSEPPNSGLSRKAGQEPPPLVAARCPGPCQVRATRPRLPPQHSAPPPLPKALQTPSLSQDLSALLGWRMGRRAYRPASSPTPPRRNTALHAILRVLRLPGRGKAGPLPFNFLALRPLGGRSLGSTESIYLGMFTVRFRVESPWSYCPLRIAVGGQSKEEDLRRRISAWSNRVERDRRIRTDGLKEKMWVRILEPKQEPKS